jgi:hypothetical protein
MKCTHRLNRAHRDNTVDKIGLSLFFLLNICFVMTKKIKNSIFMIFMIFIIRFFCKNKTKKQNHKDMTISWLPVATSFRSKIGCLVTLMVVLLIMFHLFFVTTHVNASCLSTSSSSCANVHVHGNYNENHKKVLFKTPWLVTDTVRIHQQIQDPRSLYDMMSNLCTVKTLWISSMFTKDVMDMTYIDYAGGAAASDHDLYTFPHHHNTTATITNACHRHWISESDKHSPWLLSNNIVGKLVNNPICHTHSSLPIQRMELVMMTTNKSNSSSSLLLTSQRKAQPFSLFTKHNSTAWDYELAMVAIFRQNNNQQQQESLWHAESRLADLSVALRSLLRYTTCRFRLHLVIQSTKHIVFLEQLFQHADFENLTILVHILTDEMSAKLLSRELVQHTNPKLQDALKKIILPFVLPSSVQQILVLDTDIVVVDNLCPTLSSTFTKSTSKSMFGFAPDHPVNTSPPFAGAPMLSTVGVLHPQLPVSFVGVNSGVIMWNMHKTRSLDYEYAWKHALAVYIWETAIQKQTFQTASILESFLHLGDQGIFNQMVRQHQEWLFVLSLGMNFQLHSLTRYKDTYLCQIPTKDLHLQILHGTGNVFKIYGRFVSELVWKPFLDQNQFFGSEPSILGDARTLDLALIIRVYLYHSVCILPTLV